MDVKTKAGWQTSEFWLTLLAIVLPHVTPIIPEGSTAQKVAVVVATVLAALGYSASRTILKKKL